jgi:4-hydroxybenzoate polyprenyltransferase
MTVKTVEAPYKPSFAEMLKGYVDLTRVHFSLAWPLLFCSGLVLAFQDYGGFSWSLTIRAALIGLFGFVAGIVLNDYVDRELDTKDVEFNRLTRYWRPFGKRPIPSGRISPQKALILFVALAVLTTILIATLPFPHSLYVLGLMLLSYVLEVFYQVKKRRQSFPVSQLVGRLDFALFPVAGYLCAGNPDVTALAYFVFFYPWVIAHLGVNDLADVRNDQARGMNTVTMLYGLGGTARWILGFSILHVLVSPFFLVQLGTIARAGILVGFVLLGVANVLIVRQKSPKAGLIALPVFHASLLVYASGIILDYALV